MFNESLQASQRRAVLSTSACNPVSLIHGPPGTGKTTTLAAAVLSAVAEGERVLVTAPSHAACDAVTVALAEHWPKELFGAAEEGSLIRMGHPLRLTDDRVFKFLALQDVQTLQAELLSARYEYVQNVDFCFIVNTSAGTFCVEGRWGTPPRWRISGH